MADRIMTEAEGMTREGLARKLEELRQQWIGEMHYFRALSAETDVERRGTAPVASAEELLARRDMAQPLFLDDHADFLAEESVLCRQRIGELEGRIRELR